MSAGRNTRSYPGSTTRPTFAVTQPAARRAGHLRRLAGHRRALHVDVAVAIRRRSIDDRDVDRRQAIAEPVAVDGDELLARARDARPGSDARIDERADAGRGRERVLAASERVDQQREGALGNALQLAVAGRGEVEHRAERLQVAGNQPPTETGAPELLERPGNLSAAAVTAEVHHREPRRAAGRGEALADRPEEHGRARVAAESRDRDDGAVGDETG